MLNYQNDGDVAAAERIITIGVLNGVTHESIPGGIPVYRINTLGQVLERYAADIGMEWYDDWVCFQNRRTGAETMDANQTIGSLDLNEGDTLSISQYAHD